MWQLLIVPDMETAQQSLALHSDFSVPSSGSFGQAEEVKAAFAGVLPCLHSAQAGGPPAL